MKWLNIETWAYGLASVFISTAAGSIESGLALIVFDPEDFNLSTKLRKTIGIAVAVGLITGIKAALAYLKQSPLPKND